MKGNTDKCHFIISSNDSSEIKIGKSLIKSNDCEKLLGVKIDTKLTFHDHTKDLCRKPNSNLCALGRVTSYMGLGKKESTNEFLFCSTVYLLPPNMDVPQSKQQ